MPRVVAWLEGVEKCASRRVESGFSSAFLAAFSACYRLRRVIVFCLLVSQVLLLVSMSAMLLLGEPAWAKSLLKIAAILLVPVIVAMGLAVPLLSWLVSLGAAAVVIESLGLVYPSARGRLFRVVAVIVTAVFLLFWGGLVYAYVLHLGPMPISIQRAMKCTAVLIFGSLATAYLRCMPVPPGHTFRDLLRLGITTLAATGTLLLLWSWGLGQPALAVWLHGRVPWLLPVLGLFVICALKWAGSLLRISPRRVRLRVYDADAPAPACPKCRSSMKVRFRDAWCADCRRSEPIPAEWWVCGCGAPLRGVQGDCCVECGAEFRFREPPPTVMLADRSQLPVGETPFGGLLTDSIDKSIDRSAPGERQDPT